MVEVECQDRGQFRLALEYVHHRCRDGRGKARILPTRRADRTWAASEGLRPQGREEGEGSASAHRNRASPEEQSNCTLRML